jgi:thioredoxin 1
LTLPAAVPKFAALVAASPMSRCNTEGVIMTTTKISDASFETDVLKASGPVLVDFWAEWCGPCKMIAPTLEELASNMSGKVTVAKMNIDENPATPKKYGVRGIPTLMVFKDGQVAATKIGALPKNKLIEWVESVI